MMKLAQICLLLFVMPWLVACDVGSPAANVADQYVHEFFQARQNKDYDKALSFYSSKRSADEWSAHLEHVSKSLGDVVKYEQVRKDINTALSGRFYTYDFKVKYSGGEVALEVVSLFNKVDEDETRIITHSISANGYSPLM